MRSTAHVTVLVVLCLPLFFFGLGARPLWDLDEGMHASTSKTMVLTGDWITPTYNGENFYDKPILYNWLAALAFSVFGFTELAARLPAALLACATVIVTYFLGKRMFDASVGLLSAAILAASPLLIILSRIVVHDICLLFFVLLSLFAFYASREDERRRDLYLLLMYAACGGAVLAKGPVGVVLPGLIVGLYLILTKDLVSVRRMRLGWGVVVFLAVAAPWYVLISLRNRDYAYYFFVKQNLMRFLSPTARHASSPFHHVPIVLGGFAPWSVYLPLALVQAWRAWRSGSDRASLFLLLWVVVMFAFFSIASSKGELYTAPILPAAALLVGKLYTDLLQTGDARLRRGFWYSFSLLAVGAPIALVVLFTHPPERLHRELNVDLTYVNLMALLLVVAVAVALFQLVRRNYRGFLLTHLAVVVSMTLLAVTLLLPSVSQYRSTKALALAFDRLAPPAQPLLFYGRIRESALFYTNRLAKSLTSDEMRALMNSDERAVCIVKKKYLPQLEQLAIRGYVVNEAGRSVILSNRPTEISTATPR